MWQPREAMDAVINTAPKLFKFSKVAAGSYFTFATKVDVLLFNNDCHFLCKKIDYARQEHKLVVIFKNPV